MPGNSRTFIICGILVIALIKWVIRPLDILPFPLKWFLNIAPNLLGCFLVPFAACLLFRKNSLLFPRYVIRNMADLRVVCFLAFTLAVINEYLQRISFFGRTFDYYDILFSAVGLLLGYGLFVLRRLAFPQVETRRV